MEDFVTWVDTSKLKRTVMSYNDEVCFLAFISSSWLLLLPPFMKIHILIIILTQLDDYDLL